MSYDTTPPDRIPESITGKKGIESERPLSQPPSTFESYMQGTPGQARGTPPAGSPPPQGASPMELAKPINMQTAGPSVNTILAQSKNVQDTMGTIGQQLNTPNLKLRRSQSHLLKNKLQDANGYLRSAGAKLGVEEPPMEMQPGLSPIARFLAYLGDGQDQLMSVQKKLKELSASPGGVSPGDMMYLQIKMSQAQQETEYTSLLLGKVIQSITQLLQTQL